ncbi:SusC/RagA family TonB-linked outer membrane protein [Rhodocytophaga aerolata]|uniref:SusC/RagA family TonB-linked outer membrane protein n=1 Tax=Rhodocytophaga aerolata TaxID=455078 RepID=A0ABT8QYN5_9BACT|nr:SusC/RagA family TonB-linked outer membrane protein [Rhodocytophaga aerolata]MDO1444950.1 SusC/RagA family TonB-linked outer membrane protein [Rhodocytophaga aerolata]
MKQKFYLLVCLLYCISIVPILAQSSTVAGTVKDDNNEPLPGVNVLLKGTTQGTATDANGAFQLPSVDGSGTLVFSAIGFITQEVPINNRSTINISLQSDVQSLNEVVVTALGIERQAKTLTYATQQLEGRQLTQVRDATGSAVNSLAGKVAGLTITQSANGPGGANRVVLRGNRSITGNNNALFVVDGVAIDNSTRGQVTSSFGGSNSSDAAANINPDDIESINVLKGAAAAALYGSRAANGVILITTKRGKSGQTSVDVNSGISVSNPMLLPNFQNDYGQGLGGVYAANSERSWGPRMDGRTVTDWTGKETAFSPQPDNIRDFFRNALSLNNSIGISGGSEKIQTYLSYTNNYVEGLLPNNDMMRHTANLRLNSQISDKLSVEGKITYMQQGIDNKPAVGETAAPLNSLFQVPRNIRLEDMENYQRIDPATGLPVQNYWLPGSSVLQNPYWIVNRNSYFEDRRRVTAFGLARYNLTSWLNAQLRVSVDRYNDRLEEKHYQGSYWINQAGGQYGFGTNYVDEQNVDLLISGNNTLSEAFKLNYNIGGQLLYRESEFNYSNSNGLLKPNLFAITNTGNVTPSYSYFKRNLQGVYATAQLSFRDYLILDLTARNDWSSTLPASNRSYFYPAVGLTYVLSDMITMPEFISFAKFRGSYTQVGNDANPYLLQQTYTVSQGGLSGWVTRDATQAIPDLKPELTKSIEVGMDWRFMDNRIGLDLTLYHTNTINQLLTLSLPPASGFSNKYINVGDVQNQGIEIMLTTSPIRTAKFNWNANLNFSANRNKILELSPDIKRVGLSSDSRVGDVVVEEGKRFGEIYTEGWARDPATGQLLINANGLPVLTPGGLSQYVGNFNPDWMLGFNNTFTYGNWSLGVLLDGRFGGVMVSGGDGLRTSNGSVEVTTNFREGGWVLPGIVEGTGEPNVKPIRSEDFWYYMGGRYSRGEIYTYDATNVRLREANLGYSFNMPENFFIRSARVSVVGRNLFFLYRGSSTFDIPGIGKRKMDFDPEANLGSGNLQGLEYNALPTARTLGVNINLGF